MDEQAYTKRCPHCGGPGLTWSRSDLATWEEEGEWETPIACTLCSNAIPRSRVVGGVQYFFRTAD